MNAVHAAPAPPQSRRHDHRITVGLIKSALWRLGRVEIVHNDAAGRVTVYVPTDREHSRRIVITWTPIGYTVTDADLYAPIRARWVVTPQDCAARVRGEDLADAVLRLRSGQVAAA